MGAEGLPPEFVASTEAAALRAEEVQIAAWSRCAEYLQQIVNGSASGILDSRSAALILRHEAAIRGHLLAMADQMAQQAEETRGALEEDGRIIDRLMKDLEEARADTRQARADAEGFRGERNDAFAQVVRLGKDCDGLKAALAQEQATAEGRGRALDCLRRDLEGARAEVLQARAEAEVLRAERDAALARLAAEPSEGRGCVVIELGVRVR